MKKTEGTKNGHVFTELGWCEYCKKNRNELVFLGVEKEECPIRVRGTDGQ